MPAQAIVFDRSHGRDWPAISFIALVHVIAVYAVVWNIGRGTLGSALLAWVWITLSAISIGAGYHRFYAHANRGYKAHSIMEVFYLLFGAAAFQTSALWWSTKHRLHHAHSDTDKDPYGMNRGFWWAHIGWIFWNKPEGIEFPRDLARNKLVVQQEAYFYLIAGFVGFALPALLGLLWGDPWGALLTAGFLRLCVQWHWTFLVNSLAHSWGEQVSPRSSARNAKSLQRHVLAFLTAGEGANHGSHHNNPIDPHIGKGTVDLSWWWICLSRRLGLVALRNCSRPGLEQ